MKCPFCKATDTSVVSSRPSATGSEVRRRRSCTKCGRRFSTVEYFERKAQMVTKRDGKREAYDPRKVRLGIEKACEKRPVSADQIDAILAYVEREMFERSDREATTEQIGKLILRRLKDVDKVAYVRYASVYKQFQDLAAFNAEIKSLLKQ